MTDQPEGRDPEDIDEFDEWIERLVRLDNEEAELRKALNRAEQAGWATNREGQSMDETPETEAAGDRYSRALDRVAVIVPLEVTTALAAAVAALVTAERTDAMDHGGTDAPARRPGTGWQNRRRAAR